MPFYKSLLIAFLALALSGNSASDSGHSATHYVTQGKFYFKGGEYELAIQNFSKALELDSGKADSGKAHVYYDRGRAYSEKEKYDFAIEDFDKTIDLIPEFQAAYFERGSAYVKAYLLAYVKAYNLGDSAYAEKSEYEYDHAIEDFNKALELNPEDTSVYVHRGATYLMKNEYDLAIEDFDEAIELAIRGYHYNNVPQYISFSMGAVIETIELKPVSAYCFRGLTYVAKGEYNSAMQDFSRAIELDPEFVMTYYFRGLAYTDKGEYDRAIQDYSKAVELDPEFVVVYGLRGSTYSLKGEDNYAMQDLNKVVELDSKVPSAYYLRGRAYADKGKYDRAIQDYSEAIELNPEYALAYNNRGNAYMGKGEYDHAVQDFNKAIELNPKFASAYHLRGNAYIGKGEYDLAIQDYNKTIELDSENVLIEVYVFRGIAYAIKGEYDLAILDLDKAVEAIELEPEEDALVKVYSFRGIAYAGKDEYDRAIQDFNKVIELDSEDASAYLHRGRIYQLIGKFANAKNDYIRARDITPDENFSRDYIIRGLANLHLEEWDSAKADLTIAKDKGHQVVNRFRLGYGSLEEFEQKYGITVPDGIRELLEPFVVNP